MTILFIIYLFVFTLLFTFVVAVIIGLFKGAPYIPTPQPIIRRMLALAKLKPGQKLYDLGSGDGRVLIMAVKEFGARAVGYEISMFYFLWSIFKVLCHGLRGRVSVRKQDFFKAEFYDADIVVLFLLQDTNMKLEHKLLSELRPGTRIVSRYFTLPACREVARDDEYRLYVYQI